MRFNHLVLSRYGHFTDFALDFGPPPEKGPDLHVIYGPNEAGKSTTLAAITDMLYGIERTTPWKFLHGNELLELQATLTQAGNSVQLKRFKRYWTNALDERLERFPMDLQGLSREDYQRRFSFDERTLQSGGEQILSNAGDVGQALFSASAGLSDLKKRLDLAMASANRFWIPGHRKNLRLFELKQALAENKTLIDAVKLDTSAWKRRRATLEQATLHRESQREKRAQLESALRQLERRESARTLAEKAASLAHRLTHLEKEAVITGEHAMADRFASIESAKRILTRTEEQLEDCRRARETDAELQIQQQTLEQRVHDSKPDARAVQLLQAAPRIYTLIEEGGAVHEWQQRLSDHQSQLSQCQQEIGALRQTLSLPSDQALDALLPGENQRNEWQRLLNEHQSLLADQRHAREELERLACVSIDSEADEAGSEGSFGSLDITIALALLHRLQQANVPQQQAQSRDLQLALQQTAERLLQPLSLTLAQLAELDVPNRHWLEAKLTALADTLSPLEQLHQQLKAQQQRRADIAARSEQLSASGAIDPQQLARAQRARDAAWQAHRELIVQTPPSIELQASASTFERAMQHHDHLRQQFADHAEAGSELSLLRKDEQASSIAIDSLEAEVKELQQKEQRQVAELLNRVHPFYPQPDIDAERLREQYARINLARERQCELDELAHKQQSLALQATEQQTQLLNMLAPILSSTQKKALEVLSLSDLMTESASLIERYRSTLNDRRERHLEQERQRKEYQSRQRQLAAACKQMANWQKSWQQSTQGTLLSEFTPARARDSLSRLQELALLVKQRRSCEREIQNLSQKLTRHRMHRDELRYEFGIESLTDAATLVERAKAQGDLCQQLEKDLENLNRRRVDTAAQHAPSLNSIEGLKQDLNAASESALLHLLKNTLTHRTLQEQYTEAVSQLHQVSGEVLDTASIEALSQEGAAEEMSRQLTRAKDEFTEVSRELEQAEEQFALAKQAMEELGDDSQYAWLNQQRENLLLQLSDEAKQCAIARTGYKVLETAIRRFRLEHQSAILSEARRAFCTLTSGRYEQLLPREDAKGNEQLYAIGPQETARAVTELSTGTRYQLYLALRAAAYADYASQRTPLPFVADDIMESFDDERSAAAFRVLADMAHHGQVIYLTHHQHLLDLAQTTLAPHHVHIHHFQ